jgi:hypothetical protein
MGETYNFNVMKSLRPSDAVFPRPRIFFVLPE